MAAAILSRFMPGAHSGFMSRRVASPEKPVEQPPAMDIDQSFQDAEGDYDEPEDAEGDEEDVDDAQPGGPPKDESPEVSDVDEEDDDNSDVVPSRSKRTSGRRAPPARAVKHDVHDDSEDESDASDGSVSEAAADWEAAEGEISDIEEAQADPNRCVYCQQPEDKDPGEDFEEILSCAACGDSAHRQCARDSRDGFVDDEADSWRCPDCIAQGVEPEALRRSRSRRTSSAPRMVRDLLAVVRKPGAHTIFETETYDDKHKTRHKRKASNDASESEGHEPRKRRRSSSEMAVPARRNNVSDQREPSRPSTPIPQNADEAETPKSRSTRLRQRKSDKPLITVVSQTEDQLILSFNLGATTLNHVREEARKRKRRERDRARRERRATEQPPAPKLQEQSRFPALESSSSWKALFDMYDREGEQSKTKPYGGILSEAEADTTRTFPQFADRKKFESARLRAEEEWKKKVESATAEQSRPAQKASGQASKVKCIHFGGFEIDTWHASPYPAEYIATNRVLHICEFCLKYMNSDFVAWRHKLKCPARHPPGDEIYHDGTFSFFEVDGRKNPVYCQNLCLLAKLFLGSKTLYLDVEPFLFYVMTENDDQGCHFVGYFSKEKRSSSQNNVSCILVLPIHQRRGFGHMLIDFSYLLTRVERKIGSPEKPLSDMGLVSYRSYWRLVLCSRLLSQRDAISITSISNETGMTADDVVCALEGLRALVRDPLTKSYALRLDYDFYKEYVETYEKKGYPKIDPKALMWVPYIMGRNNEHYENVQISTVAQREDDTSTINAEEGIQLAQNDISARDFAEARSNMSAENLSATTSSSGDATSQKQRQESDNMPFPELEQRSASPSKHNQPPVTPTTPMAKISSMDKSPIPATRFEVFPPLPGMQRKKAGRPFARGSARRGTPLRRGLSSAGSPTTNAKPSAARRTRSALAEMTNGDDEASDEEERASGPTDGEPDPQQDAEGSEDERQMVHPEGEEMDVSASYRA